MASNDALLLHSLLRSDPERDGPDPFGFARSLSGAPPRREGFVSAGDLDSSLYTVFLQSITGIDPAGTYTEGGAVSEGRGVGPCSVPAVGSAKGLFKSLFVTLQVFHLGEPLTPAAESSHSLGPRYAPRAAAATTTTTTTSSSVDAVAPQKRTYPPTPDTAASEGISGEEVFDECIGIPLTVSSLPLDCEIRCCVFSTERGLVGTCRVPPFSTDGTLQNGYHRLPIHSPAVEEEEPTSQRDASAQQQQPEWERVSHALHRGAIPAVPWLDAVTRRHLMDLRRRSATAPAAGTRGRDGLSADVIPGAFLHLHLPVPSRAVPVVYLSDTTDMLTRRHAPAAAATATAAAFHPSAYHPNATMPFVDHYKVLKDNSVCEAAAAIVARSAFLLYDANATPGWVERARLLQLANRPPLSLEPLRLEDVSLLWRYRHCVTRDTRLFIPFMRTVDWHSPLPLGPQADSPLGTRQQQQQASAEARAACELIPRWRPLDLSQVLGCLSFTFSGVSPVRRHAIRLLDRESDELLCWIALQLVQALRYDSPTGEKEMATFLVRRATGNWELCATLHWSASVEAEVSARTAAVPTSSPFTDFLLALEAALAPGPGPGRSQSVFLARLRRQRELLDCLRALHTALRSVPGDRISHISLGQRLLAKHACGFGELFARHRGCGDSGGAEAAAAAATASVDGEGSAEGRNGPGGTRRSRTGPARGGAVGSPGMASAPSPSTDAASALTLPTHPAVIATAVNANSFYVFKSAKQPMQVGFTVSVPAAADASGGGGVRPHHSCVFPPLAADPPDSGAASSPQQRSLAKAEVRLMFKDNDDVRQDQLMVQLIHWIDTLLKRDGLDLCLTSYRVLATGCMEGLVEVVPDVVTFQSVQRDALRFLRVHNPTSDGLRTAMDRYTRSFAGYSVLTFVLGVGDRHLENLLLARDGRLLHIDFGYILGHDPKPFPPPMKISTEMLEVLGGPESAGYTEFKAYCCMAYNILRKHAALLLNVLQLMCHAEGLPQLTGEAAAAASATPHGPPPTVAADHGGGGGVPSGPMDLRARVDPRTNLLKVQEKLRLGLSNAQAAQYIQDVIADSVGSVFTGLWDVLHAAAQAART